MGMGKGVAQMGRRIYLRHISAGHRRSNAGPGTYGQISRCRFEVPLPPPPPPPPYALRKNLYAVPPLFPYAFRGTRCSEVACTVVHTRRVSSTACVCTTYTLYTVHCACGTLRQLHCVL